MKDINMEEYINSNHLLPGIIVTIKYKRIENNIWENFLPTLYERMIHFDFVRQYMDILNLRKSLNVLFTDIPKGDDVEDDDYENEYNILVNISDTHHIVPIQFDMLILPIDRSDKADVVTPGWINNIVVEWQPNVCDKQSEVLDEVTQICSYTYTMMTNFPESRMERYLGRVLIELNKLMNS